MALYCGFHSWLFAVLFVSARIVNAQKNTCISGVASVGAHCLHHLGKGHASAYCSAILDVTTPTSTITTTSFKHDTVFVNSTKTTGTITSTGTPPITTTINGVTTLNSTTTIFDTTTVITGTRTSFVSTTTSTSLSVSVSYTCGHDPSSGLPTSSGVPSSSGLASFSSFDLSSFAGGPPSSSTRTAIGTGISSSHHFTLSSAIPSISLSASHSNGNLSLTPISSSSASLHSRSVTPSGSAMASSSASLPAYTHDVPMEKRQGGFFPKPRCLKKFQRSYGLAGVTSACECLDIATPSALTTTITMIDATTTITSTNTVEVVETTVVTPTTAVTSFATTSKAFSTTRTVTERTASTISATSTVTTVSTTIVTSSSPTPTSFNIFYIDASSNSTNPPANFFKAVTAPGGSGIILTPESTADSFMLDSQKRLVDTTDGNEFIAKNSDDLYPFELLQTRAVTANTPTCSACGGFMQCDYPGTTGNTFALCFGALTLGPPNVFGKDSDGDGRVDCTPIRLQLK